MTDQAATDAPEIDLSLFCSTERAELMTPWSAGAYTYASDGVVGVRIARRADVTREDGLDLAAVFARQPPATRLEPLPPVDFSPWQKRQTKPCPECGGIGHVQKCANCDGDGECECYACGHEHDCDECKGAGYRNVLRRPDGTLSLERDGAGAERCNACAGTGLIESRALTHCIALSSGMRLNAVPLGLIATLPGVRLDMGAANEKMPVYFQFDGGDGLVQPLNEYGSRDLSLLWDGRAPQAAVAEVVTNAA